MSFRIRFRGKDYWLIADTLEEDGAIAPLAHCDEKGGIADVETSLTGISYAHYFPGRGVIRFGQKIGERGDIEIIQDTGRSP